MAYKRYVPISEYQRMTNLSYPTIKNALETGQIKGIRTEAGYWKIDTQDAGNTDTAAIVQRLENTEKLLKVLCKHLGVNCTEQLPERMAR